MSRLSAERWSIGLAPDGAELQRLPMWRKAGAPLRVGCKPEDGQPAWAAALAALEQALDEARARGGRASVVLSNHFVRYLVLPWQPEINSARELEELARLRLAEVYGEACAGWQVRVSEGGWGQSSVVSAIDGELIAVLKRALESRGLELGSLQPVLMTSFNELRRTLGGEAALAIVEPGRLCLGLLNRGAFEAVVLRRTPVDAAEAVDQELATLRPQAGPITLNLLRIGEAAPTTTGTGLAVLPRRLRLHRRQLPAGTARHARVRALELDFVQRRARWPSFAMALVGLALAFDAGTSLLRLQGQERELTQAPVAAAPRAAPEAMTEELRREFDGARRLLLELALPWERLFHAIDGAVDEDTALLAVEPDAAKQTLQITGEARSYLAVLNFMSRLEQDGTLTRVHLLNHEVREDAPEQPTQFTLAASWRAAQ